jgi:hypothetical protein
MPALSQLVNPKRSTTAPHKPSRRGMYFEWSRKIVVSAVAVSALSLTACNKDPEPTSAGTADTTATKQNLSELVGCYTVGYGEPAQIKVSQQGDDYIMQMKEPASAKRVWDTPEALEVLPISKVPEFFSIDANNIDAMLGRPDRFLVLAHVKSVYANIDPLLDSEYLAYIYKGANTVYKVECDEVKTDILADPHANIVIKQVGEE